MKKWKYVILTFCLLLPSIVKAQTIDYTGYKVGDVITVNLDEQNGKIKAKFRVIVDTNSGRDTDVPNNVDFIKKDAPYQYVTAIYEGTIGESVYTKSPASKVAFATSDLKSNLIIKTKDLGWVTPEEIRLLKLSDLSSMFSTSVPTLLSVLIKQKYPWLVLDKSYWLEDDGYAKITGENCATSATETTCNPKTENVAHIISSSGAYTTLGQASIAAIRPVIKIHKGFVDGGMVCVCKDCEPTEKYCPNDTTISIQACLDNGTKESDCIEKLCPGTNKPDNPKTGTYISIGILFGTVSFIMIYCIVNRKKYFRKI